MNALKAFNTMVAHSGHPKAEVSVLMGRNENYVSHMTNRGSIPRTDIMAEIADVCGYDLTLIKRDGTETIIIDPPSKEQ